TRDPPRDGIQHRRAGAATAVVARAAARDDAARSGRPHPSGGVEHAPRRARRRSDDMRLRRIVWLVVPVAIAAAVAGYRWWPRAASAESAGAEAAAPAASGAPTGAQTVSVMAAQQRDVPVVVEAAGTVVSLDTVDLRPQVAGTI